MAGTRTSGMIVLGIAGLVLGVGAARADQPARLVADTVPGTGSGMSSIASKFVGIDGYAYFKAGSPAKLWRSDGYAAHTVAIPGTDGALSDPVLMPGTSQLVFTVSANGKRSIMSYDPTRGMLDAFGSIASTTSIPTMAFVNGRVVFVGVNQSLQAGLWSSNGSYTSTVPLLDPSAGTVVSVVAANARAFVLVRTPSNVYELWSTDGTPEHVVRAAVLTSAPAWGTTTGLRVIGDRVLFAQTPAGSTTPQVWVSDGTPGGTQLVSTMPGATTVEGWTPDGTGAYGFRTVGQGTEFWRFSPRSTECQSLLSFARTTRFTGFGSYGSLTLFGDQGGSYTATNVTTLWISDGSAQNTLAIPGFPGAITTSVTQVNTPGSVAGMADATLVGSQLYLAANVNGIGQEPWHLDLATGTLEPLGDLLPGANGSMAKNFFPLDGGRGAGFLAYDTGQHYALYTSTGQPAGTTLASHMTQITTAYGLTAVHNRVFMMGFASATGYEPYVVDLCPADFDNSGVVDVGDLMGYLNEWFAGGAAASGSGAAAPTMNDLMGYVSTWFTGC